MRWCWAWCCWLILYDAFLKQAQLDRLNNGLNADTDKIKAATEFVNKVSFAQSWHMGNPRYLACLRDLTDAMPQDFQTYAMALTLRDEAPPQNSSSTAKPVAATQRTCSAGWKWKNHSDQQKGIQVVTLLKKNPKLFKDVKSLLENDRWFPRRSFIHCDIHLRTPG